MFDLAKLFKVGLLLALLNDGLLDGLDAGDDNDGVLDERGKR